MAQAQQYDLDEFDADAEATSEARVVNVTDQIYRFEIASAPGSKPRRYRLGPYGKPDCGVHIQVGYTLPFRGVGREPIRATIESMTEREVFPGGPRLPMVVHEDKAEEFRERWARALKQKGKRKASTIVLNTTDGEQLEAVVERPRAAPEPEEDFEDVEDQGPPPGAPEELPEVPDPVIAPAKASAKGKAAR